MQSVLVKEQAKEVHWVFLTVSPHVCIQAKAWWVELSWVRNTNDIVEEAGEQKEK